MWAVPRRTGLERSDPISNAHFLPVSPLNSRYSNFTSSIENKGFIQGFLDLAVVGKYKYKLYTFRNERQTLSSSLPSSSSSSSRGARNGAVVRALASHQCGPGSNPGVDAICGLNLLWVEGLDGGIQMSVVS